MLENKINNIQYFKINKIVLIMYISCFLFFYEKKAVCSVIDRDVMYQEIAISLDDAPMPDTVVFKGIERTKAIIKNLKKANSPPVGIFALGKNAENNSEGMKQLIMYAKAGHFIANHSYSHYKLGKEVSAQDFIKDIERAHQCFCNLPNFKRLFRFPGLYEGENSWQREEVLGALATMGYKEGYVTVCNYDFWINHLVVKAIKNGQSVDYDKLRKLYLKILWECIDFYGRLAYKVLGRKVKHVLLLHANDLAAFYLGDLIDLIRKNGWKVISIEEAYKDQIANIPLTTIISQGGRISSVAHEKKMNIKFDLSCKSCDDIQLALEEAKVFSKP